MVKYWLTMMAELLGFATFFALFMALMFSFSYMLGFM